ncbi:MAG TPA: deoxyribodipyrimidine photo-lyase [Planctomycetota bacterium]|nr:deoxyribodipyrimidine photo-lyase [Planctomycetota bacterium]
MRQLFWFRHDLRLGDNTGFYTACRAGEVVPCVVLDDAFLKNPAIGPSRCALFLRAVSALARDMENCRARLIVRRGKPEIEIPKLLKEAKAGGVICNRDYEPYAVARDERVRAALADIGAQFHSHKDLVIFERGEVLTQAGGTYTVFTPYKKMWLAQDGAPALLPRPAKIPFPRECMKLKSARVDFDSIEPESDVPEITEKAAQKTLDAFLSGPIFEYARQRDLPSVEGTSRLSAHLKFGTISPRTVLAKCRVLLGPGIERSGSSILQLARAESRKGVEMFIGELIWRDFFFQIMGEFPRVAVASFRAEYDAIKWENEAEKLARWKEGRTGFPIVDAGMRQLAQTGWMHNRVRMIVACFLCKDLLIDWREGERHFSRLLIDGEPAVNNGNWQWAAGTGTDAQPYFRIFNPTAQGKRFDPAGAYVRRWVPELSALPDEFIHEPWLAREACGDYAERIVDHAAQRAKALSLYRAARK